MDENKNVHLFAMPPKEVKKVLGVLFVFLVMASLFMLVKFIGEAKGLKYIGGGVPSSNTISVDGSGEAFAIPDIATISFSVLGEGATPAVAQKIATDKVAKALEAMKNLDIAEKDIKTTSYDSNPKYDYGRPCTIYPCPIQDPKIIGYEVSQSISVKVRDTEKAGDVLEALGTVGVTNISGPDFTIDNEDVVKAEARADAISDAKTKADELASELGVTLVRIVNFSESSNNYPGPVYYEKAMSMDSAGGAAPAPELPSGENKYSSYVTITYEIR
jgi:uncharacterized protein YggE